MKFKVTHEDSFTILSKDSNGKLLASLEKELCLGQIASFIIDIGDDSIGNDEQMIFKNLSEFSKDLNGILVFVSTNDLRENINSWESEKSIWLPTIHEAQEAIFMNNMENQLMSELGEDN